ncbi:hypothetical protein PFICI_14488 [Pestalotiopsis fici W106-1]|uniref:Uncharacterized protein n=1 Tax=Pestalotiopsis fici (strain W106-1 / CGMCC3.15140) TaxID=1229662 RepID=W3WK55_PESFW|nr:uncharacterized protein PFICI_14488 [Pestalotiopsis fici W106-1]ETS73542.1 hypothetical protein PFICI_14488 [Pestalotiopsis fici W106-1]
MLATTSSLDQPPDLNRNGTRYGMTSQDEATILHQWNTMDSVMYKLVKASWSTRDGITRGIEYAFSLRALTQGPEQYIARQFSSMAWGKGGYAIQCLPQVLDLC